MNDVIKHGPYLGLSPVLHDLIYPRCQRGIRIERVEFRLTDGTVVEVCPLGEYEWEAHTNAEDPWVPL